MKRRSPSTTVHSLSTAFIVSLVRALATTLPAVAAMRASAFEPVVVACACISWSTFSMSMWEYQTSRVLIPAISRIASR